MTTRIYIVGPKRADPEKDERRLVRALNSTQALRHVARDTLAVGLPSQEDLIGLGAAGVRVEVAGADKADTD